VWQDTCHYLYLPRLVNDQVFRDAIAKGVETEDYFGFVAGKDGDRYLGFAFGSGTISVLDESSLLIDREAALAYRERMEHQRRQQGDAGVTDTPPMPTGGTTGGGEATSLTHAGGEMPGARTPTAVKKQFYGTVSLDPIRAKMDFATIMDEVVQQFTSKLGVDVKISVEIQAQSKEGFDETLQRIIKENCNVLQFDSSEFEDGE